MKNLFLIKKDLLEDKLKTIYVVTAGDYSDYHIEGVYSTKEKARLAVKLFGLDDFNDENIEEWKLDETLPHPKGMWFYVVEMNEEGDVNETKIENAKYAENFIKDRWRPYGDDVHIDFYMWAKDEKHAIKIANEMRIQLIANNQWDADWDRWSNKNRK